MALDAKFFRKARKVNRAVEITDLEAIIPAVGIHAEVRVPLPNRRPLTFEERNLILETRKQKLIDIESEIEEERKTLFKFIKGYPDKTGASKIISQNQVIKELMETRSQIAYPQRWIEETKGLSLKDIFETKRDIGKIGASVYQVKHRIEPISSLYVDIGRKAEDSITKAEEEANILTNTLAKLTLGNEQGTPTQGTPAQGTPTQGTPAQGTPAQGTPAQGTPAQGTPAEKAKGVIIGRTLKLKKSIPK